MKKNFINRCLAILGISFFTLFNAATTNAQTDVLDLFVNTGDPIMSCETSPDVEINVNLVATDPVTTVIIQNISGYRLFDHSTCDKKYKFCAPNGSGYCTAAAPGEIRILLMQNSANIGVRNLSFIIYNNSIGSYTVKAFNGLDEKTMTQTPESGGIRFTWDDPVISIDKVVVTFPSEPGINTEPELFVMDKLFIPSVTGSPLPDPPTITPSGPLTFCAGGNVTLTSSPGISYLWSTGSTTSSINVTAPGSYSVTVIPAPQCTGSTSAGTTVAVNLTSVGGSVTGGTTICAGTTSGLLTLAGHTGSVTKWQSSPDGITWTDIANTAATYTSGALAVTTQFRAVVQNGVCPSANSSATTVIVNPASVGGSVTGGTTISSGTTSGLLTLAGHTGAVTNWQSSPDGIIWADIVNTSTTYTSGILTITTQFRAVVKSGVCTPAFSGATTVTVSSIGPGAVPEVICLVDLSGSMNMDFYDHYTTDINKVKLTNTKNALIAFVDLLNQFNSGNVLLGLARFPNYPQTGCEAYKIEDLLTLTNGYRDQLLIDIPALYAQGSTPLLNGINYARDMFSTATGNRKVIVMLSDGRQNCPTSIITESMKTATTDPLNAKGILLYTIGFGDNALVPNDLLNELAGNTTDGTINGMNYNITALTKSPYSPGSPGVWDPATALHAAYANIIVNGLGLNSSTDPLDIINQGTVKQFDIPVTVFDDKVCFFVSWTTPLENYLGIKLYSPSGTELNLNQAGINTIHRNTYTIITLSKALLDQPGMSGIWRLKIDGSELNSESEHYQYTVINSSKKIDMRTSFEKRRYFAGDKMKIFVELLFDGKPLTGSDKVSVTSTRPAISLGNWLVSKKINNTMLENARQKMGEDYLKWLTIQPQVVNMNREAKENSITSQKKLFLSGIDPIDLRVNALKNEYKLSSPERVNVKGLRLKDDGKNGDLKAGDGIYTTIYTPKLEGSYTFNLSYSGTLEGEKTVRESHLQTYVSTRIPLKPVFRKIKLIEKVPDGETIYDITFLLKDKYGNIPMPDALNSLALSLDKGILKGGITDNMDGTFTQRISLPVNINPKNVIMTLTFDGMSGSTKITVNNLRHYLLAGSALAIITTASLLLKNKKN